MARTVEEILAIIGPELAEVEGRLQAATQVGCEPLGYALKYLLLGGGKRLRPAIAILSAKLNRYDARGASLLATAVEMLHTATLVHDDLLDNSVVRRGRPTLNQTWNKSATILVGDYLFAQSANLAAQSDNLRAMRIFSEVVMTICGGEIREILQSNGNRQEQTLEGYYESIYAKTASLFAASAETGAVLSDLPEEAVESLRDYGHNLGMAFQITDDVLDFTGDERRLGKPVGSDLRQGLLTLPALKYREGNPGDERLGRIAGHGSSSEQEGQSVEAVILELIAAIVGSGAIEASLGEAERFGQQARESLQALPGSPYRRALEELAEFTLFRNR